MRTLHCSFFKLSIVLLAGGIILSGCSEPSAPLPVTIAEPGPIPATAQRPGDPDAGYTTLVNRGYVSCGIPYSAFRASSGDVPVLHPLPGRQGRNAELPHTLNATTNADGVELVVSNCLSCHAAKFDGELVIGLGNAFMDFTEDAAIGAELIGAWVEDGPEATAWAKWADRIGAIAPYMRTDTVGVNPAPNLTLALMAHRDPETLAWYNEPQMEPPPTDPLPTKVPPWWRMQHKHAMFYNAMGRGDHTRYMMMKALVCTDDLDEAREIAAWFDDVRAYIARLPPPAYPYPIDHDLAEQGREVFERTCSDCHGTYGAARHYPNELVALDKIGTDPAYAQQAVEAERFARWFNQSFYGQGAEARPGLGYVAPPLDGVWATAPYLHNASVPSIAVLLNSPQRPTYWRWTAERRYDPETLGWTYERLDAGQQAADGPEEARQIYDTTRYGYGNQGHTAGDKLSEDERRAVLEYLKTL